MARFRSEALVGVFVVASCALLIWGSMQISHLRGTVGYELAAVFPNVSGLDVNSPVRMVGVKVGRIKDIALVSGGARVTMEIDPAVKVPRDSALSIRSTGILGDKFVEIEPGRGDEFFARGDTIEKTRAGADMDRLLDSLQAAGEDLREILAAVRKVVATEKGTSDLAGILDNVSRLSGGIARLVEDNGRKVDSIVSHLDSLTGRLDGIAAENREEIRLSIANIREITSRLKDDLPRLSGKLEGAADQVQGVVADNREEVKAAIAQIRKDAEVLEQTLTSVNAVAKKIESGEGTIGKLVNDDKAYKELTGALEGVNKYIRKGENMKFNVDIHANYLSELGSTKGYATIDIFPSPDKFYRLELMQDPEGDRVTDRVIVEPVDPPAPLTETVTTTYKDRFKFSLEMGRRYYDTVLRLGFIESTFGMGMDRLWSNDNLRLSADFWDLNRDEGPQSRLAASWRFLSHFHVDVGSEDFFNRDRKPSLLVGMGLTFVDDDLKYLLSSAPKLN
jgi:phospholipid/cholesterol/gamma-HCH transport system substrate-binding protein